jgi:hypothetical protein
MIGGHHPTEDDRTRMAEPRSLTVSENPWHNLPDQPPFVLPDDKDKVEAFNKVKGCHHRHFLHLNFIPEPYVGNPDARLVLLGNNPGVADPPGKSAFRLEPAFATRMRNNLLHQLSDRFPFLYLDPDIIPSDKLWWEYKLKHIFEEFGNKDIAKAVMARIIFAGEFFLYVSHKFGHGKLCLPSQKYSFELVRNAMKWEAVIVLTRGEKRWLKATPELHGYHLLVRLKQVQRAPISARNCRDNGWAHIREVISRLRAMLPSVC